eukprot:15335020-Alexandrium_andersonii.AAC.1
MGEAPEWFSEAARREAARDRRLLVRPEASQLVPQLTRGQARVLGPTLYRAAWWVQHQGRFRRWCLRRSRDRRWWPTDGQEWA